MATAPFLRRVRLKNYKSIGDCDVELGRFTILVGRNGSGKSNFLDALAFVSDALNGSILYAVEKRDKRRGLRSLLRRSASGNAVEMSLTLDFDFGDGTRAEYGLVLGIDQGGCPVNRREYLRVFEADGKCRIIFESREGKVSSDVLDQSKLRVPSDGLTLAFFAEVEPTEQIVNALRHYRVYDPQPQRMRGSVPVDAAILESDGANAAAVMMRLQETAEERASRLVEFLSAAVDDLGALGVRARGHSSADGSEAKLTFYFYRDGQCESCDNREVSDGTLRALAVILAAHQRRPDGRPLRLIGIEEPEVGLHPAASGVMVDALKEGSLSTQILITTHSPDILDRYEPDNDRLLAVRLSPRGTLVTPISDVNLGIIRDELYSAGELLRMGQLDDVPARIAQ